MDYVLLFFIVATIAYLFYVGHEKQKKANEIRLIELQAIENAYKLADQAIRNALTLEQFDDLHKYVVAKMKEMDTEYRVMIVAKFYIRKSELQEAKIKQLENDQHTTPI